MKDACRQASEAIEISMMQRDWVSVFVGLGANLGDARHAIEDAVVAIGKLPDTQVISCSSLYLSAPVDALGPDYINAVVHLQTRINAYSLLDAFQALENSAGRERPYYHAPRTLDIDMLLFGSASIESQVLVVPHPRMRARAFVMFPLAELAPHSVAESDLQMLGDQRIQKLDAIHFDKLNTLTRSSP
jgi:2-amino-4-hydroxy-6-hydroxymethyldihydropteridine diphosphokinase